MISNRLEQAVPSKHDLEDHIDELLELDELRRRSAELRDNGIHALKEFLTTPPGNEPQIDITVAATLYRHAKISSKETEKELSDKLKEAIKNALPLFPLELADSTKHPLSVLEAAFKLRLLAVAPDSAFSQEALCCFYWIVRELYTTDAPDWRVGGSRAAPGGPVSASMTSACLHAILDFAKAQEDTAKFIGQIREFVGHLAVLEEMPDSLKDWKLAEKKRLQYSYYLALQRHSKSLALRFEKPETPNDLETYVFGTILENLIQKITEVRNSFDEAINKTKEFRRRERADSSSDDNNKKTLDRSMLGHTIAFTALTDGKNVADAALEEIGEVLPEVLEKRRDAESRNDHEAVKESLGVIVKALNIVEQQLRKTTEETRKVRHPAEYYLEGVLEHQLAVAESEGNGRYEADELAFAAECLGALDRKRWGEDKRLLRAAKALSGAISDRGRFPVIRPFHYGPGGGFMVDQADLIGAFSKLVRQLRKPFTIKADLARSLLHFFEETWVERVEKPQRGWCEEHAPHPHKPDALRTASAVKALASLNQMLDERINSIVLDHFKVKKPADLKSNLDEVFYPDYGLNLVPELSTARKQTLEDQGWPTDFRNKKSVAITLQEMRAHVSKAHEVADLKPIHSLVLHGPPGTGKTFLVEALAKSCDVPMVEITPSDIVIGGMEAVERRARDVFKALALLTRVVVLFDEFDPVLWRRDPKKPTLDNVFSFLTPGMLPKLKTLHDQAEKRSLVYVLSTNLIGSLDEAAVRKGRFDEKVGLFPPDVLSRAGRLHQQYYAFKKSIEENGATITLPEPGKIDERIFKIIQDTGGGPMDTLGKPKYFTEPKLDGIGDDNSLSQKLGDTPFGKIFFDKDFQAPEAEARLKGLVGEGKTALREWMQWEWVSRWDENIRDIQYAPPEKTLENIIKTCRPGIIEIIANHSSEH